MFFKIENENENDYNSRDFCNLAFGFMTQDMDFLVIYKDHIITTKINDNSFVMSLSKILELDNDGCYYVDVIFDDFAFNERKDISYYIFKFFREQYSELSNVVFPVSLLKFKPIDNSEYIIYT